MSIANVRLFSIEDYHRLSQLGFFGEDEKVELVRGQFIEMVAKETAHEVCISKLNKELTLLLGSKATIRVHSPVILPPDSQPEPDFTLAVNKADNYLSSHPIAVDILLVIEVADSSLKYDRELKLPLYAEYGIVHYWIFNLLDNSLETYAEPYQKTQGDCNYRLQRILSANEAIALPSFPDLSLDLSKIFPTVE